MPGGFEMRSLQAKGQIDDALGQRPLQAPQMPMPQMQQPMPQMQQPMQQQPMQQQPMQQQQRFQEGGLATSVHAPQDYHQRDIEFINTRNQRMRELAGLRPYAEGGGAWTRKEGQNPEGGLNAKGRASLRAQGHDIKPPVSAKLAAKSPKAAARRKSFCARMSGMEGPMEDENGKPTRKALALRKWDCKAEGGSVKKPVWAKPRPDDLGKPKALSAKKKASAKARAEAAGRPYPNLVDNLAVARKKGK